MTIRDELDPLAPQREAALFYGLFLRGHSAEKLRRDIDLPKKVVDKWFKREKHDPQFCANLRRLYEYRKRVLAIFDNLVDHERHRSGLGGVH